MEIVVTSRKVEVPARVRSYVQEKLSKVEKLCPKVIRVDVEISRERNPRLADSCERVELTCISAGPPIRAEAAAETMTAAFDLAWEKLEARLRKAADRRRVHRGNRTPSLVAAANAVPPADAASPVAARTSVPSAKAASTAGTSDGDVPMAGAEFQHGLDVVTEGDDVAVQQSGPLVVREKVHVAAPMTLDQALYEMELVGHDFFLFVDRDSHLPSVVYRRRGYDYGVIRLVTGEPADGRHAAASVPADGPDILGPARAEGGPASAGASAGASAPAGDRAARTGAPAGASAGGHATPAVESAPSRRLATG